ncbi:hypothetical protein [uncultured Ruthenibacterium sp.]|uniref:hypothetical protein n=1 Tax=uncultured Ruthenibacterium sp. TaxID=1905347 RepID=UPI00349E6EE2
MDNCMEKTKRWYDIALLALGIPLVAGVIWSVAKPSAWAMVLAPCLGVLAAALTWCALARFCLCRRPMLLKKSFTRPFKLVFGPVIWVLYTLAALAVAAQAPEEQEDLVTALATLLGLGGALVIPVLFLVCSVAAVFFGARHMKCAQEAGPAYREAPFALALIWLIGLLALCIIGMFYLLI